MQNGLVVPLHWLDALAAARAARAAAAGARGACSACGAAAPAPSAASSASSSASSSAEGLRQGEHIADGDPDPVLEWFRFADPVVSRYSDYP